MLLMELHDEFARALPVIEQQNFSTAFNLPSKGKESGNSFGTDQSRTQFVPFFETVIRYLGGLLSAHALSNEPILLKRADDLATKLSGVFDTPHGIPSYSVNIVTLSRPSTLEYIFTSLILPFGE